MKNKNLLNECKCVHCQNKLEQINNSKLYWDKLILKKIQPSFSNNYQKIATNLIQVSLKISYKK